MESDGRGRPALYCTTACRRISEYRLNRLLRRIERCEIEIRELQAGLYGEYYRLDPDVRRARLRRVRKWLKADHEALRTLVSRNVEGEP